MEKSEIIAESCLELLITDASGIYIPKEFIESRLDWQLEQIKAQTSEGTIEILKDPEDEWYWEAWEEVLNVEFIAPLNTFGRTEANSCDACGRKFTLHQNGDLWAVKTEELEKYSDDEIQEFWDSWN